MVEELFKGESQVITIVLIVIVFLLLMAGAMIAFFFFSRKRVIQTELEKANLEIEHQKDMLQATIITQEEERKRIAQDMHDAISSKLNVVSLNANILANDGDFSGESHKIAETIVKVTGTVLESSRKIAHDLLPPTLQKFGLRAALEELCDEVEETRKFKLEQAFNYKEETLSAEEELHVFRIAQELINNAIKYSEATKLKLKLDVATGQFQFTYKDNGKGFNLSEAKNAKGLGLSGIENRAAILNADLNITTKPGDGLFVEISKQLP